MARRIRIPALVDLVLVDDPGEMRALNRHPDLRREIPAAGPLVTRALARRVRGTLAVGDVPLPVFADRDAPGRELRQARLERRLGDLAADLSPLAPEIDTLGAHVAGRAPDVPVGVVVQQAVGRMFLPGYRATPATYAAAKVIDAWPRANPLRALWWRWTGRLARSRALLWEAAGRDPQAIHATAIAMHNLVDAVERMRQVASRPPGPGAASAPEVIARCLVAPRGLLRVCVRETRVPFLKRPLAPGTLVLFRVGRMYAQRGDPGLALSRGEWSLCPAHGVVPRLLEAVWLAAAGSRMPERRTA
jgi:hypothetical protein